MLAVAERLAPDINWQRGVAEMLPFADRSFDRVFSQFGLMFFDDRGAALREMRRVHETERTHASGGLALFGPHARLCGHRGRMSVDGGSPLLAHS